MNESTFTGYLGFLMGLILGGLIAVTVESGHLADYKKEAIDRGFAKYHETTGQWQWKGAKK